MFYINFPTLIVCIITGALVDGVPKVEGTFSSIFNDNIASSS